MKKQYIIPEVKTVIIETVLMQAVSGEKTITVSGDEQTEGFADSRESGFGSFWSDGDEEE